MKVEIRRTIAVGFHEILKIYLHGPDCKAFSLDKLFIQMLNDEAHVVNGAVISHLEDILPKLLEKPESSDDEV